MANADIGADVIVTAAPVYRPLAALRGEERFPEGSHLLLIHAGKPDSEPEPLLSGFWAEVDANVSFDGKKVLFAGKQAAGDPWQIWEMTLKDRSLRRVIAGQADAIRPLYLPSGRLVYALRTLTGFQLQAAGKTASSALAPIGEDAASTALPLAYLPASVIPVDVLQDGRILFEAGFPLGSGSTRNCFWSTPMARALSRTAAITAGRAGAESSWHRAMLSSRTSSLGAVHFAAGR